MFNKLALRNVKRSLKDYLVYFLTMTLVTALMFAFNSLLFSDVFGEMSEEMLLMQVMIGLATFFIVLIVAWLINYMVRFILEKRSKEFGIYLLLGMRKKQIARLYMRENILLGTGAFLAGIVMGILVQQMLLAVLYGMTHIDYRFHVELDKDCLLFTLACYGGCFLLALLRCKRKFKKMNIYKLMNVEKQNEEIKETHEEIKKWLLPISVLFLLGFAVWLCIGKMWGAEIILLFLIGLVLSIYLFYTGLSSWIICYVRRKGAGIYKGQNLFLLRQFSAKIKTMRFTMGTLTALFVLAFLGGSVAMMFQFFQDKMLEQKMPFAIQIYSASVEETFTEELALLEKETSLKETYAYRLYENGTAQVNVWLYTHLRCFGDDYLNEDGTPDMAAITDEDRYAYCAKDPYMALSDYNYLRRMLGYEEVALQDNEYAIHMKDRVFREAGDFSDHLEITGMDGALNFTGYHTEAFSQDGHNGGDYVIVVPDREIAEMTPYWSELAADIEGSAPENLMDALDELKREKRNQDMAEDIMEDMMEENRCCGSDQIVTWSPDNLVRDNIVTEMKMLLSSLVFPLVYMGLVFLCVALTVLSVQQLSDSAKYKFRYGVMRKIGMDPKETAGLILKQLVAFYLCPALFAVAISGSIAGYVGGKFNFYTGIKTPAFRYFGISLALFFSIYCIYFLVTYIEFVRNVDSEG
ncbi:MAG: ABC transporter permease [Muribaculaceae bacterium]|nr:ABC transporter permease [Muribaculaceae bacterium]